MRASVTSLILPAATLSTIPLATVARITRAEMPAMAGLNHVRTARAKGMPERQVGVDLLYGLLDRGFTAREARPPARSSTRPARPTRAGCSARCRAWPTSRPAACSTRAARTAGPTPASRRVPRWRWRASGTGCAAPDGASSRDGAARGRRPRPALPHKGALFRAGPPLRAVAGVSFAVAPGEVLGLVGESGSGKSTIGNLALRLDAPTAGTVRSDGRDITRAGGRALRSFRRRAQPILPDPYGSLDPRMSVEQIVGEALAIHGLARGRRARSDRVVELLAFVGLDAGGLGRTPH